MKVFFSFLNGNFSFKMWFFYFLEEFLGNEKIKKYYFL
ncbi:hypothetical protein RV14_GL001462 [Enterococcus ratti]|uniref:Uncharacterized protein n=1 Tax=Enterococcus ratti TaxID=150033 RepID=A0A1L8WRC8_9ENTE|nr:hypothetical protein RV14_GL001462 [Enterococcus ratti]